MRAVSRSKLCRTARLANSDGRSPRRPRTCTTTTCALGQTQDEVRALLSEPDEVFFSEIAVERDETADPADGPDPRLVRGAPPGLLAAPRHARRGGAWYRLMPRAESGEGARRLPSVGFQVFSAHVPSGVSSSAERARSARVAGSEGGYARPRGQALTPTSGIAYYSVPFPRRCNLKSVQRVYFFVSRGCARVAKGDGL